MSPRCPIRGHAHDLEVVRTHVQKGTGATATTWGCPDGRYRWFVLDGRPISSLNRRTRPRYGWPKDV